MSIDNKSLVIFANQLLPLPVLVEALPEGGKGFDVFMAEDVMFCRHYQYHQQKLVLMLAAMRHYADELRSAGFTVHYHQLDPASVSFQDQLHSWLQRLAVTELWHFEIETKPLQSRLRSLCAALNVTRNEIPSPMFLCNRQEFESFVDDSKSLQMARFYKQQRLKLDILLTPDRQPQGQGPTERQAHAAADPALPAGDSQKTHSCDALEQQFALGCQTGVRLLGETAPVVKAADHHERQGDAADSDQLNRSGSFDTDPAAEDHPHGNHQQPPRRGGSGLGLMTAGPLGPNHLTHLQCSQPGNADGRCQRCGDGGGQQRQGQLAVGDPFV